MGFAWDSWFRERVSREQETVGLVLGAFLESSVGLCIFLIFLCIVDASFEGYSYSVASASWGPNKWRAE
jgi:hypothetical protein